MTRAENKLRIKLETLNKIKRIYQEGGIRYSDYESDGNRAEQRDDTVRTFLEQMNEELSKI